MDNTLLALSKLSMKAFHYYYYCSHYYWYRSLLSAHCGCEDGLAAVDVLCECTELGRGEEQSFQREGRVSVPKAYLSGHISMWLLGQESRMLFLSFYFNSSYLTYSGLLVSGVQCSDPPLP